MAMPAFASAPRGKNRRGLSCLIKFRQFPSGPLVCALLVASGLVWTMMFFGPLAHLSHLARGVSPFDIRPMGYSYNEAYAFLSAIGERGRRYYANRELLLDMFHPPL